jgi:hypothetical protein
VYALVHVVDASVLVFMWMCARVDVGGWVGVHVHVGGGYARVHVWGCKCVHVHYMWAGVGTRVHASGWIALVLVHMWVRGCVRACMFVYVHTAYKRVLCIIILCIIL